MHGAASASTGFAKLGARMGVAAAGAATVEAAEAVALADLNTTANVAARDEAVGTGRTVREGDGDGEETEDVDEGEEEADERLEHAVTGAGAGADSGDTMVATLSTGTRSLML